MCAITATVLVAGHTVATGQLPFVHRENVWSIAICHADSPFALGPATKVLAAGDVTDVPALFVADPFLLHRDGLWYMFFEVLNRNSGHGDIGLAVASDGINWRYQQIVLDEPFHLSYPYVFQSAGRTYMVPESEAVGEIRLYESTEFPHRWELVKTLVQRPNLVDPSIFPWRDRWWMFAGQSHTHDRLTLFFADDLKGPWREHPASPLMDRNPHGSRPGGRILIRNDRIFRMGQDCSARYGHRLLGFEVTRLTPWKYEERPWATNPILQPASTGWNDYGMHHCDLQRSGRRWIAAVDGHTKHWVLRAPRF